MVCLVAIEGLHAMGVRESERIVVLHLTTQDGNLQEIGVAARNVDQQLVYEGFAADQLTKGRASEVLYLGGGLSRVCVEKAAKATSCGFADSSLHVKRGDVVYFREARFRWWTRGSSEIGHTDDGWFISKAEAEVLVATGKFKMVQ